MRLSANQPKPSARTQLGHGIRMQHLGQGTNFVACLSIASLRTHPGWQPCTLVDNQCTLVGNQCCTLSQCNLVDSQCTLVGNQCTLVGDQCTLNPARCLCSVRMAEGRKLGGSCTHIKPTNRVAVSARPATRPDQGVKGACRRGRAVGLCAKPTAVMRLRERVGSQVAPCGRQQQVVPHLLRASTP